jgi:adenosylcobinamide-GDP ribazoletransferase
VTGAVAGLAVAVALLGLPALWAAAAAGLAAFALGWLAVRRIGGVNGDVLGAVQQLGEILTLLVAVAVTGAPGWESPVSSVLALVSGSS